MLPHLKSQKFASIAPHDTFIRGDVQLIEPTLLIKKQHLEELLNQQNPEIMQTLKKTEIILLDDNCNQYGSPAAHVAYVLRYNKQAPFYKCHDHGVNIDSRQGVYANLYQFTSKNNIPYGSDHFYSDEKQLDSLHFMRNIAEDEYSYLAFVANNPKFNLSPEQKQIFTAALSDFSIVCEHANKNNVPLDFSEENTPKYNQGEENEEFSNTYRTFNTLSRIINNAFDKSKFYETVDLDVLAEETTRYNEEYKKAIESGAEFNRAGSVFKSKIAPPTEKE